MHKVSMKEDRGGYRVVVGKVEIILSLDFLILLRPLVNNLRSRLYLDL